MQITTKAVYEWKCPQCNFVVSVVHKPDIFPDVYSHKEEAHNHRMSLDEQRELLEESDA